MSRFPEPIQIFADKINSNIAQQFQLSNRIERRPHLCARVLFRPIDGCALTIVGARGQPPAGAAGGSLSCLSLAA
jgi:hypothetical protein